MKTLRVLALLCWTLTLLAIPASVAYASCDNPETTIEAANCGSQNVSKTKPCNKTAGKTTTTTVSNCADNATKNIVNTISLVAGIVAVFMIMIGGYRFVTSGGGLGDATSGKASNVSSARNTVLYALVGLIIIAVAQVLVRFVFDKATKP